MSPSQADDSATDTEQSGFSRRRVLRNAGAAAVAGSGLVGTASASEVDLNGEGCPETEAIVFCGCSSVC